MLEQDKEAGVSAITGVDLGESARGGGDFETKPREIYRVGEILVFTFILGFCDWFSNICHSLHL